MVASAVLAGVVVALACGGMTLTTSSAAANFIFEPLSLLLLPGLVIAAGWTSLIAHLHHMHGFRDNHEFAAPLVVMCSLLFYFVMFAVVLLRGRVVTRDAASR